MKKLIEASMIRNVKEFNQVTAQEIKNLKDFSISTLDNLYIQIHKCAAQLLLQKSKHENLTS